MGRGRERGDRVKESGVNGVDVDVICCNVVAPVLLLLPFFPFLDLVVVDDVGVGEFGFEVGDKGLGVVILGG